jgi:hypothetical protein
MTFIQSMFKHFMKNATKNPTRNIAAKLDGYDKVAIGFLGVYMSTCSLIMYQFLERDRIRDKIWKRDVLKKNDTYK